MAGNGFIYTSIVILVHGTNAHDAPWTRSGSRLREVIAAEDPGTLFVPFNWTGRNSHSARLEAGRELADLLRRLVETSERTTLSIVCHSHGGNVVLYALRDKSLAERVSGVVFLGTPFLRVHPVDPRDFRAAIRQLVRLTGLVAYGLAMLAFIFGLSGYGARLSGWIFELLYPVVNVPIVVGLGLLPFVLGLVIAVSITKVLQKSFGTALVKLLFRRRGSLLAELSLPALPVRGLVCVSPRDEAYLYLLGLAVATSTPQFVWSVVLWCIRIFPLTVVVLLLGQCFGDTLVAETDAFVVNFLGYGAIWLAALFPAVLATTLVLFTVPAVMRGNPLAFGWTGLLGAAVADVWPTYLPPIVGDVSLRVLRRTGRMSGFVSLVHSAYYSDTTVLNKIGCFLQGEDVGKACIADGGSRRVFGSAVARGVAAVSTCLVAMVMLAYDYAQQHQAVQETMHDADTKGDVRVELAIAEVLEPGASRTVRFNFENVTAVRRVLLERTLSQLGISSQSHGSNRATGQWIGWDEFVRAALPSHRSLVGCRRSSTTPSRRYLRWFAALATRDSVC